MKRRIQGIVLLVLIIFLCTSGLITKVTDFFVWLVTLHYSTAEVSAYGEIFVKIASFVISFGTVGLIIDAIGFHDKKLMSWSYYLISTLVSFALCYVVMLIETYLLAIVITLGCILIGLIAFVIIKEIINKRKLVKE